MVATAAAIISMARSVKAVKTAQAACGSSANATGTISGTSRSARPSAAARMTAEMQNSFHAARIGRSLQNCGPAPFNDTVSPAVD
jgi:hypothetical protein